MNEEKNDLLKKIGFFVGIFILLILFLWGSYHISFLLKEEVYYNAAEAVIKNSPLAKDYKTLKIYKNFQKKQPGFCNALLKGEMNNMEFDIIFLTLTGKYGIYQGVFLNTNAPNKKPVFCGLAGNVQAEKSIDYYGINQWQIKLKIEQIQNYFSKNSSFLP